MNERDLVRRAKNGDKNAFAALYLSYKDDLYRYAYFKLRDSYDAQDAVSACITEAFSGIGTLRKAGAFKSWIFQILYRCCCGIIAGRVRRENAVSARENTVAEDKLHLAAELGEALDALSSEEREIVLLSAVAGYTSREIAGMLNLNSNTVRSKLSRGLQKMRTFLG